MVPVRFLFDGGYNQVLTLSAMELAPPGLMEFDDMPFFFNTDPYAASACHSGRPAKDGSQDTALPVRRTVFYQSRARLSP
ncbi:MAG: hypothetical protein JNM42_13515 [Propionivibrio sp.]|uniref:hypothetical protein n=1 Tax=Propionivibrio sp. TaxID=2212460 RepID=UPI001A394BBE|nr:hypothetical protein [Propionivibrio sp.]MBL8415450.1 hypothetical protein [Propionivibrio sp.]